MKSINFVFILLFFINSCNFNKKNSFKGKKVIADTQNRIVPDDIDTLKTLLPVGNKKIIKYDFPDNVEKENVFLHSINEFEKKYDSLNISDCFVENGGIEYEYFQTEKLFEDSKVEMFQRLFRIPDKFKFKLYIDKVSDKCNNEINLREQYCISIYKDSEILRRYNIGYIDSGDLYWYKKYWFIDKNHIIYTRIIGGVAEEEEESNMFISKLNKYKITRNGRLVFYFDKVQGLYASKTDKGNILNHTKQGIWEETKYNNYVNDYTYVKAFYDNGIPRVVRNYYKMKSVNKKEKDEDGYEYYVEIKKEKTDILLMSEKYDDSGNLLERNIFEVED
ncbi:hypothetical protein [Olleya sp. HaHaR_3_96]|uniref:hypothetical protein n=1 Tax=Olleya sp. HaHaR_3_96 TaxID=2745560 RepID=UPI001C4F21F4|nr:hypothetical protein [Olleya sp. HaHaR_3_96]QXP58598.1 hypothetical protein H0I26_11805 [Olleya sp. HaHaR_3_96]